MPPQDEAARQAPGDGEAARSHTEDSILLVRRAQDGDREAYERLFARYYPRVLAIAAARLGQRLAARIEVEDLTQEALVQAIRSFERFELRDDAQLIGWLARIVEHRILEADRRQRVRDVEVAAISADLTRGLDDGRLRVDPEAPDSRPLSHLIRSDRARELRRALAELEPTPRELILRRVLQGSSWAEIAEELELPSPDAARMAFARARIALARRLGRDGEAPASDG